MKTEAVQGFNKETILGMLKSKTVNINTIITAAIVMIANTYGLPLTPVEAATLIPILYGAVNIVLRFFTNKPLPEKGIVVENPEKVRKFVAAISENEEALKELYTAIAKWKKEKEKEQKFSKLMEKMEKEGVS